MTKVFVIAPQPMFRRGLISTLENAPDLKVIGEASDTKGAIPVSRGINPDILLFDLDSYLAGLDISEIEELRKEYPNAKVILLSSWMIEFTEILKAGVQGYLLKSADLTEFIDSVRLIASGNNAVYATPPKSISFNSLSYDRNNNNGGATLSSREKEVLFHIAKGENTKEIADACYISEATVKAHVANIVSKLNAKNRSEAVAVALETGLLNRNQIN